MLKRRKGTLKRRPIRHDWDPRFLRREVYLATTALVVCLFVGAGVIDRYVRQTGSPFIAAVIAATLVELANGDRAELALDDLRVNPLLAEAARLKANDMAEKSYFSHVSPEGHNSWYWLERVGYDYTHAGENLAVDFSESADVENAWMKSESHRANILHDRYTEIGIAVATGTYEGRPTVFAVQMFGRPSAKQVAEAVGAPPASVVVQEVPRGEPSVLGETSSSDTSPGSDAQAIVLTSDDVPFWARVATEPKQYLRYAYYIIGLLILLALFFDLELEIKWHHVRHAARAGTLLATMSILFIVADWVFFAEPVLAVVGKLF